LLWSAPPPCAVSPAMRCINQHPCWPHLLFPSPPQRGRGVRGEGGRHVHNSPSPSPPTPLPRSGGEGGRVAFAGLLFALLVLPTLAFAEEPALKRFERTERHMGTHFRILVYAPDEATAGKAMKAAFDRIEVLNGIMSDYTPTSELMRLCAKAGGPPVKVSGEL